MERESPPISTSVTLPDDANFEYPEHVLDWVNQYYLSASDLRVHKIYWSHRNKQLIYPFKKIDEPERYGMVQARNFASGPKYTNIGEVNDVFPIYLGINSSKSCCIVEDVMSAIRVADFIDGVPLLGSHLPMHKIMMIKARNYDCVHIWLDNDKYKEALRISDQLELLRVKTHIIQTDEDPKVYKRRTVQHHLSGVYETAPM